MILTVVIRTAMGLSFSQAIFLFFAAAIAGTLNALAGGGSFVAFPALLFVGVPAVQANATNTIALWPGLAASLLAYLKKLNAPARLLIPLLVISLAGGWAGAMLLLHTPQQTFLRMVPWLLLSGTLLFAFGNRLRAIAGSTTVVDDLRQLSVRAIVVTAIVELPVAIYGGYFGAGVGFILLGMLAAMGMRDVNAMGALRTLLAAAINAAAVVTFIFAGAVLWRQGAVMIVGASAGGWFGARYAMKSDPAKVRAAVITIGLAMTVYFFVTLR
jgi:uncharacterized membrane protein YfcA